mgnify:CR=1 FL=1
MWRDRPRQVLGALWMQHGRSWGVTKAAAETTRAGAGAQVPPASLRKVLLLDLRVLSSYNMRLIQDPDGLW